mgnify:FL=1
MIESVKTKIEWVKSANFLAGLALLFSSFLFFYDLFDGRYLLTERDLGPYFIPPRFFWVESLKHWDFPLWNPYQFAGHPFFANPQHAILYPLNSLFLLLPFDLAFNTIIILHFFLGGLFTYFLLKDLNANTAGALISGLIFMLSGYLLSVHSLLNCLLSVIWTPLVMMFFRRALQRPGLKNEIFTSIVMAISFLGGGVEIVYGNFLVLLFMVIFSPQIQGIQEGDRSGSPLRNGQHVGEPLCGLPKWAAPPCLPAGRRGRPLKRIKRFRSLFIVSIVFLLLSAVQLIPFLELWVHSIRGKGIPYQEATIWSFAPKDILLFFLPDAYGYFLDMKRYWVTQCWLKTLYTGGLPFILSLVFFLSGRHVGEPLSGFPNKDDSGDAGGAQRPAPTWATGEGRSYGLSYYGRSRTFYLSLILLSLFLSLGQYNPLYPLVHKYIPFFNGIRYPVKFLYIFILVLSITAGLGFQKLMELPREDGQKKLKKILILFSLGSGLVLVFLVLGHKAIEHSLRLKGWDIPHFNDLSVNLFHAKRFLFYLTLFFLLLRVGLEVKWRGWTKILVIFFLVADLFGNMGFYGKERTAEYFQKTKILEIVCSNKEPFRVFSTGKTISIESPILIPDASPLNVLKEKHLPTMNLLHRLHDLWGIDVVRLKKVDDLYHALTGAPSISATPLIDLYGVKYVISVTPLGEDSGLELVYARIEGLEGRREDLIKGNTIKLYRKKDFRLRAWLVKDFRVMEPDDILLRLKSKDFDPAKEVLLEEKPLWVTPNSELLTPNSLGGSPWEVGDRSGSPLRKKKDVGEPLSGLPEFISETNTRLQLLVEAKEDSFLVLSDTYFPGWKAYVDGKEEKIHRANYTFRAVSLPQGKHKVEFVYRPMSFRLGCVITVLTIIACIRYWPD